jgi:hypothetical protein
MKLFQIPSKPLFELQILDWFFVRLGGNFGRTHRPR